MPAARSWEFEGPKDPNTGLWRYMDFTKFVHMLESKSLFFARADRLGDPFEGTYLAGNRLRQLAKSRPSISEQEANFFIKQQPGEIEHVKWRRQWAYINCWHQNSSESTAMWKLYAKSNEAIVIRTTFGRLWNALSEDTFLGVVKYIDFDTASIDETPYFNSFLHKRHSFVHEREVRAVFTRWPFRACGPQSHAEPPEVGLYRGVRLSALIEAVYLAPTSPTWLLELTTRLCHHYDLRVPVLSSALDAQPHL
jgi:hypothetical protein